MKRQTTGYLRTIIVYKTVMALLELFFGVYIYIIYKRSPENVFATLAEDLHFNLENILVKFIVDKAEMLGADRVTAIIAILITFSVFNLIEAWGLHIKRSWAEWLTVCGTGALIPFEIWEIVLRPSFFTLLVIIVNSLIVYYLARHKELFHGRKEKGIIAD